MADRAVSATREASMLSQVPDKRSVYHCECGRALRVFGGGRHRLYFECDDPRFDTPVMDGACPQCGLGLPGKNRQ